MLKVLLETRLKRSHLASLAVLILSNMVLFWTGPLYLGFLGGVVLFCFLPGWLLIDCLFPWITGNPPAKLRDRDGWPRGRGLAVTSSSPDSGSLPADSVPPLLEKVLLSAGASYLLSSLSVFAVHALPGEITLGLLCLALDVLVLFLLLVSFFVPPPSPQPETVGVGGDSLLFREMLLVILLVMVAGFFRFFYLGYSEFQGDEVGVVSAAVEAILGHDDVLFLQRKGPVETLVTTAFALFTQGFDEFTLRFPFTLASFLGVITIYLIGRRMFGSGVGFIAGMLFAIEGITLAFSRMVQYQGVVVLMLALCVYCFYRFHGVVDSGLAHRYQFLGAAFFAFGLLTHYDVGPVALLLALLYLSKYGLKFRRLCHSERSEESRSSYGKAPLLTRNEILRRFAPQNDTRGDALTLLSSLAVAAAILLVFYLPFILHPHFNETGFYVAQSRLGIGQGPYNNLGTFVSYSIFYNSTYYVALMMVLLALGVTGALVKGLFHKPLAYLLSASFAVALFLSALFPSMVSVDQVSYAFVLFLPAAIGLVLSRQLKAGERIILLWFFVYFVVYCFVVREPGLHFYTLSAAWAILGGIVLDKSCRYLLSHSGPLVRGGVGLVCLLLYTLLACYTYIFFIQTDPEYANTFPANKVVLYWTPQVAVPGSGRFGIPRRSGWKAVGYLYQTGVLRGGYTTNARKSKTLEWYTRTLLPEFEMPRYFLYSADAERAGRNRAGVSKEVVEEYYNLVGRVMVQDKPKVLIYEDKRFARGEPPVDYRSEEYESRYDGLASLAGYRLWEEYNGDDRDFQAVARFLEASAHPGGGLVLNAPQQVGILSYYYRGDLPYYSLPQRQPLDESETTAELEAILAEHDVVYGLFWAAEESDPHGLIEGWLDQHVHKGTERWFGNVRLALYTSPPVEARGEVHYLQDLRLGKEIELLAYEVDGLLVEPSGTVDLTLYWAARSEIEEDYTVFTHLIDVEDRLWAQQDNQPQKGEHPTLGWREGEVVADRYHLLLPDDIPAGQYRLEVGMYQWQMGERLSVFQGDREIGNRVLLAPEITVE
ncbi:MAG: glycosyltransferase family 39 protein [Anaerolineales bacterium]|nr:MAG: glycosyltransferase family 39 protein [Anaerolineales bacterium]